LTHQKDANIVVLNKS